ncbi:type II secretion system protein GspL [Microbulbifer spongiae]|uniref:Type II secretion system protein L n=1 Tax=Microbulbifer spongiae TaxID=2944933 RepID=A0ABY9EFW2_9GAMM|nr:type II secretion system protein GspL [Microbulbifer sp. MI-G]WKD51167.1 type II secretion system protein GspL [Microbulbifer sp. MI-G]
MFKKKSLNEIGTPATPPGPSLVLLRLTEDANKSLKLFQWQDGAWEQVALDAVFISAFNPGYEVTDTPEAMAPLSIPDGAKALLLVPGNWVWSGVETIPRAARRQANAIGYMVEERLAEEVENLHFTCVPREGDQCSISAVGRDKMAALHTQVERLKWPLVAAVAEYQVLDLLGDDLVLWLEDEQVHLWQHSGQGLTLRREYLQPLLGSILDDSAPEQEQGETNGELGEKNLVLLGAGEDDGLIVAELESLLGDRLQCNHTAPEAVFLQRFLPGRLGNLLSGEYQLSGSEAERIWWLKPAKVAAFCFAAQLLFFVGAGAYYQWQAGQAESQARALFTELLPNTRPTAQLRRQLEGLLKNAGNQAGAFSTQMQQLSTVWTQHRGKELKLQSLRFDGQRGEMVLQLQASTLSDLDTFVSSLSGNGLRADLLGANELKNGVSGRVRLR